MVIDLTKYIPIRDAKPMWAHLIPSERTYHDLWYLHKRELQASGAMVKARTGRLLVHTERFPAWFVGREDSVGGRAS